MGNAKVALGRVQSRHMADSVQFSSVSQSCLTLQPYGPQHTRSPGPSPTPEFTQTHVHPVGDAIQLSHLLSSPSPLTFNLSEDQDLLE